MTLPVADPLPQLVELVRARRAPAGRPTVVGVDGPSGAGKSTLAARLADALGATLLPLEQSYPGWDGLDAATALIVEHVLEPLAAGARRLAVPIWDWEHDRFAEPRRLEVGDVLVLEGVGAGSGAARRFLDALVWVEAPEAQRKARAFDRDGDGYRAFWDRWAAQERITHAREATREHADIVVDTTAR